MATQDRGNVRVCKRRNCYLAADTDNQLCKDCFDEWIVDFESLEPVNKRWADFIANETLLDEDTDRGYDHE